MRVQYLDSNPFINKFSFSNRILTENLIRNDKLDVTFGLTGVMNKIKTTKYVNNNIEYFKKELRGNMTYDFRMDQLINFTLSSLKFMDGTIETLTENTILYSSRFGSIFDLYPVKYLLKKGFRVVLGGQITAFNRPQEIRKMMNQINCSDEYLKNLIIVKGYLDLTTDLYKIIKKWKDYVITENSFKTIYECENDYIQRYIKVLSKIPETNINLKDEWTDTQVFTIFDNRCLWGKCKFCFLPETQKQNFIENVSEETIAENIINSCKKYGVNNIYIANDYFSFTPKNEKILNILVNNNMHVGAYGGILMLKDREYVRKVDKYFSYLMVGLETCNDFALSKVNKGYCYKDIVQAFENVRMICKSTLKFSIFVINDLPYRNKEEIIENYVRLGELKGQMNSSGFEFPIKCKLLQISDPNSEKIVDNKFIKLCDNKSKHISGDNLNWKHFERIGLFDHDMHSLISKPFERYDEEGNILESDMFIVSNEIYQSIL